MMEYFVWSALYLLVALICAFVAMKLSNNAWPITDREDRDLRAVACFSFLCWPVLIPALMILALFAIVCRLAVLDNGGA